MPMSVIFLVTLTRGRPLRNILFYIRNYCYRFAACRLVFLEHREPVVGNSITPQAVTGADISVHSNMIHTWYSFCCPVSRSKLCLESEENLRLRWWIVRTKVRRASWNDHCIRFVEVFSYLFRPIISSLDVACMRNGFLVLHLDLCMFLGCFCRDYMIKSFKE